MTNEEPSPSDDRPLLITILCIIAALAAIVAAIRMYQQWELAINESATWFVVSIVALLITIACIYGLWRMKRWAVVLLAAALMARIGYSIVIGQSMHLTRLVGPIVLLVAGLVYFRRMT